jgi:hypothetical protein
MIPISLPVGPHTVEIIAAQAGFLGFVLLANPSTPLSISVDFPA